MQARLVKFGEIEVEGKRYTHDVVIDGGKARKRKKGPSKQFREKFGHTPLSRAPRKNKSAPTSSAAAAQTPPQKRLLLRADEKLTAFFGS